MLSYDLEGQFGGQSIGAAIYVGLPTLSDPISDLRMLNALAYHLPGDPGRARLFVSYLFALHSVWAFAVAGLWLRVWLVPNKQRVAVAALATAVLLVIGGFRLSSAVVLDPAFKE